MEKVFVGRQAIYKDGIKVFGYELLSRQSELNRAAFVDGDKATAELLLNTFINIGLEQVVGPSLAFVNVTRNFVLSNYYASLPKDRIVFEISDKAVDEPWLSALTRLSGAGYPIALDNFVYAEHLRPLIERSNIVKIDVQALNRDEITCQTEALRRFDVKLLAQKVETHDDYQFCKDLGFDYFQGYFFCKPQVLSEQKIPFNRLSSLHLLSKLQDPQITVDELELAVGQDVAVSYRILRYLNSPVNAMPRKIESLRHAISLVGTRLICNWASLILMEAIEEKPRELVINTMIRAYMCQQLGALKYQGNLDQFFTVGLLSLMDALLDKPFPNALESLPLAEEVKEALLYRKGLMGEALSCVQAYERCDWDHASFSKLDEGTIREAYLRSLAWTRNVIRELV